MNIFEVYEQTTQPTYTIPVKLKTQLQNISLPYPRRADGRTLNNAIDHLHYNYTRQDVSLAHLLQKLIAHLLGKSQTNYYICSRLSYTSTDTITAQHYNRLHEYNTAINDYTHKIILIHLARGKTYLEHTLNTEPPTAIRRKDIETALIRNQFHFIRVYTAEDYTYILSDIVDSALAYKIMLLTPHFTKLIDQYTDTKTNTTPLTKKQICINALIDLYNYVYTNFETDLDDITEHTAAINNYLKIIAENNVIDNNAVLNKFADKLSNIKLQHLTKDIQHRIDNLNTNIKDYTARLTTCYLDLEQTILQQATLENQKTENVQEFISMLSTNPHIQILSVQDSNITIDVTAPLKYYRPEDLDIIINNPNSVWYTKLSDNNRALLHAALIENKFQILISAQIAIQIRISAPWLSFTATSTRSDESIRNPHLTYYNCWTAARSQLEQYVSKGMYELIVPQLIAAVQTINVAESATFYNRFLDEYNNFPDNVPIFINTETNEILTKKEALKILTLSEPVTETIKESNENKEYTQTEIEDDDEMWEDFDLQDDE